MSQIKIRSSLKIFVPERVTSAGINLHRLVTTGQERSEETLLLKQAVSDNVSDLTARELNLKPPALIAMCLTS